MAASDFVSNIQKELVEKKGVASTTADLYVRTLMILNDKTPFKNLAFLKKTDAIMAKLGEYAESTQKTILAAIVSVLGLFSAKPTYKNVHAFYHGKMIEMSKEAKESETSDKTQKQKDNWIDWATVKKLATDSYAKVKSLKSKTLTPKEMEHLLNTTVLSLYTCVPPRRNQDYLNMVVVKKWDDKMDNSKNYLDLEGSQFVFNKYKTAKKYGVQHVAIPNDDVNPLMDTLVMYLKHHPLYKKKSSEPIPFLVGPDGNSLTAVNSITRILNRIFGKKVGSSLLRHIFLSDKYDIKEMEEDAADMGHSVEEARKYLVK